MDYLEALLEYGLKFLEDAGAESVWENDRVSQRPFGHEPLGDGEGVSAGMISPTPGLDAAHKPSSHHRVMDPKSMQKEELPRGSSGSVPASTAGGKVMSGTGTGDAAGNSTHVPNSQKGIGSGVCQGTRCLLELIAIVVGGELVFLLCCAGIWYCWKRKRRTSGQQKKDVGYTSDSDSLSSFSHRNKGLGSPCKSSEKRTPNRPSTRAPPIML
ncbi:uncharacterized protein LOC117002583 [Catharus ustulatus]|uniref:uncharacterized protein LOC117002583 n=1 Tax=Catharus ustulatus TaxID=91951 RepID=UPI00140D87FB|nr:uncharacterized protein LOC117002583 [Catharus ustulatus]